MMMVVMVQRLLGALSVQLLAERRHHRRRRGRWDRTRLTIDWGNSRYSTDRHGVFPLHRLQADSPPLRFYLINLKK
jgi:hypothetical protein